MSLTPGTSGHLEDTLVDLLLGELEEEAQVVAEEHLAGCAACAERLASLSAVRSLVAEHEPGPSAPESLWEGIQAAIRPETARPPQHTVPAWPGRWSRLVRPLGAGAVAAALLTAAVLAGWWGGRESRDTPDLASELISVPTDDLVFTLAPVPANGPGAGRIFMSDDRTRGMVAVVGLPQPSAGRLYAVWLVRNDQVRVSAGSFTVDERGASLTALSIPTISYEDWTGGFAGLAVTEVDPANPARPAGPDLLAGPLY